MRRLLMAWMHVALGLAAGQSIQAQVLNSVHRPEPKIVEYRPTTETTALVAVMGQVGAPNTYQFDEPPTLELVLATARGATPAASPMIRIVRGHRVAQSVAYPAAAQQQLQSGDVVIVDRHPQRTETPPVDPAQDGVQLALLGVTEGRPYIVKVLREKAHPTRILEMLGQQSSVRYHLIPPPNVLGHAASHLPEGTVLIFDRGRIDVAELPDDLPKIVLCGSPPAQEQADIVGYGLHQTYEPPRTEPVPPQRDAALIPLPPPEEYPPLPTMVPSPPEHDAPYAEAHGPLLKSAPISTVPFTGTTIIPARPSQFTETAPPATSSAADAREPQWDQHAAATKLPDVDDLDAEEELDAASGAFSIWQMLSILSTVALIVGLALALRANLQKSAGQKRRSSGIPRQSVAAAGEVRAPIPTPHIPLQSFSPHPPVARMAGKEREFADSAEAFSGGVLPPLREFIPSRRRDAAAANSLEQRQRDFAQIIHHEVPVIEEPIALRPGIQLVLPSSAANKTAEASTPKQFIDSPHARHLAGPHRRGAEAPVERALRQLQGDPS